MYGFALILRCIVVVLICSIQIVTWGHSYNAFVLVTGSKVENVLSDILHTLRPACHIYLTVIHMLLSYIVLSLHLICLAYTCVMRFNLVREYLIYLRDYICIDMQCIV